MKLLQHAVAYRTTPALERNFSLPFGHDATFHWQPDGLKTHWCPDVPSIRKPRARRKFFTAYQVARRSFLEEVAAVIGGRILILDISNTENSIRAVAAEFIREPTKH
jgi:hypothetical protein